MNKTQLTEFAEGLGLVIDGSMTKAEIQAAIDAHETASIAVTNSYKNISKTPQAAFGKRVNIGGTVVVPADANERHTAQFERAISFGFFA